MPQPGDRVVLRCLCHHGLTGVMKEETGFSDDILVVLDADIVIDGKLTREIVVPGWAVEVEG